MLYYVHINNKNKVEAEEALDYVCEKCGIKFEDISDNKEQLELKEMLVEWYFSGNWIKEEIKED